MSLSFSCRRHVLCDSAYTFYIAGLETFGFSCEESVADLEGAEPASPPPLGDGPTPSQYS